MTMTLRNPANGPVATYASPMPAPGDKIGRYILERPINRGSQGEVWRALDENARAWALKLIFEAGKANAVLVERERWEREVLVGASVRHDCLPAVVDSGESPEGRWLVSEFIEGNTLAQRYRSHLVQDAREFAGTMVCVCTALEALHHAELAGGVGVVHRDVKPANVLISGYGSDAFAWLVDLGTAKLLDGSSTAVLGTLEYLAPEQVAGRGLSAKTDVWAAAAVAFWLLTGHTPVPKEAGETNDEYLRRRLMAVRAASVLGSLPVWAAALVPTLDAALADDPEARPTALELARAVSAVGWPHGAPLQHEPLLAGHSVHDAETLALIAAVDSGPPPTLVLPRAGLVELADRVTSSRRVGPRPWRAIAIIRTWAQGADAAGPAWHEAVATGDRVAAVRAAAETERIEGWQAAQPLWQKEHEHGSPEAAFRLARHALETADRPTALGYLREALERGHTEAAYRLAVVLREENAHGDEAQEALKAAVAGAHPRALTLAGNDAYDSGQIARAEALWEHAASLDVEEAAVQLARLHLRRGDPGLALAAVDDWAGVDSLLEGGLAATALGDAEEASRLYEAARKQGSGRACAGLGNQAWYSGDWAAAETHFREALDRGFENSTLGLGAALLKQGKRFDAELVFKAAAPSATRAVLLAAVRVARGDPAAAREELSAGVDDIKNVDRWARDAVAEQIRALAETNAIAMVLTAEAQRLEGAEDLDATRHRCLGTYRAAAALGSQAAAEWAAYYEPDPDLQRELLTRLLDDDRTGFAHSKVAELRTKDGDASTAVALLRAAAERGWLNSMTNQTLLDACDEDEEERWLRLADRRGSAWGANLLGRFFATRLGADLPDVEGAYGRADLRGGAQGACDLGLVLYAKGGTTAAVIRAWERASRRGSGAGAYNAGIVYDNHQQYDRAATAYERAIELGYEDGYVALAGLEWTRGNLERALELAEEAYARHPSKTTAYDLARMRSANGDRFGAIEAYKSADALGTARAALELADLWDNPADISAALDRAHRRFTDTRDPEWLRSTPYERAKALVRIEQIRERRLTRYDGASVRSAHVRP